MTKKEEMLTVTLMLAKRAMYISRQEDMFARCIQGGSFKGLIVRGDFLQGTFPDRERIVLDVEEN